MKLPEGFTQHKGKVSLLRKALYGLKQTPQRWFRRLTDFLKEYGLVQLKSDKCIFKSADNSLYLAIHVDGGILLSNISETQQLLNQLKHYEFEIVVEGNPKTYLDFQLSINEEGITVTQAKYAKHVLQRYGMDECRLHLLKPS